MCILHLYNLRYNTTTQKEIKMRTFFVCLLLLGLSFFSLIPVVHAGGGNDDIASLQAQIIELLEQIRDLQSNRIRISHPAEAPTFEHVAVGFEPEQPKGNFVYFQPIIWESFQDSALNVNTPNVYGRYDHRLELLRLSDEVQVVLVIVDDQIISVRRGGSVRDPVEHHPFVDVVNNPRMYPELHSRRVTPSDDHIVGRGFAGKASHGFYPVARIGYENGFDVLVGVGSTFVGITFPKDRRTGYNRQVRIVVVSDDGISCHGYPSFRTPSFLDYAGLADMPTHALGLFRISEMVRDVTLLLHEIESVPSGSSVVRGAPAAPHLLRGDSKRLMSDIVSDMKAMGIQSGHFSLSPRGKKLTTWGALKSAR